MKQDIKDKWVAALRSGEYPQTTGSLRDEEGYCCLGVLCDLLKDDNEEWIKSERAYNILNDCGLLPVKIQELAGMESTEGVFFEVGLELNLAELNDEGSTFVDIANIIEAHWEEL